MAFDARCGNCASNCEGANGHTKVYCDVGFVDFDLKVNKQANAFFELILADRKINLAAV